MAAIKRSRPTELLLLALVAIACPGHAAECAASVAPAAARISAHGLRVGVAFGGGSSHGMAHVGVIDALERSGLEVSVVTGTSMGAVVGALWASGLDAPAIARHVLPHGWKDAGRLAPGVDGFMTNAAVRTRMREVLGKRPIESWPRRFAAVATHLADGHRRLLTTGPRSRPISRTATAGC